MIRDNGKTRLEEITRRDVEAFIEHEQDRGNKITTIRTKLVSVQAFLRYLVEEEIVSPDHIQQEDTIAITGAAAAGHGSGRFAEVAFRH